MSKQPNSVLTARDIMTEGVVTLSQDMKMLDAIQLFIREEISGAPVIDQNGNIVGILSEFDCLRVFASGEYTAEDYEEASQVGVFMRAGAHTIEPELDIYSIAHLFTKHRVRRLPVVENDKIVGIVSRRDVLRGIDRMRSARHGPTGTNTREPGLYLSATDSSPGVIAERLD